MDALKRIENAEEELRLAKEELECSSSLMTEAKQIIDNMHIRSESCNITLTSKDTVRVTIPSQYYFISKYLPNNWSSSCIVQGGKLSVRLSRKETFKFPGDLF